MMIPEKVSSIEAFAFRYCFGMKEITFKSSVPPTVAATTFGDLPKTCIIKVPRGTLAAYKASVNYPDPAEYTYEELAEV